MGEQLTLRAAPRDPRWGVAYVEGKLSAHGWDNTNLPGGGRGVIVWGTGDVERARPIADYAIRRQFGEGVAARHPEPGRWRLFPVPDDPDESEYRPAPDAAKPSVLFTAEEVT
ncbi:hypothetical protein [Amycolatopsis sp. NPDC001319]|uniref:hypothetical protein n=1 Tax=unclassified Amycolatopsis TaxID=2618356 RepID=UPI0036814401